MTLLEAARAVLAEERDRITGLALVRAEVIEDLRRAVEAADRVSPHHYVCEHCGRPSLKEAWGPGRITCPRCGLRALSPAERERLTPEERAALARLGAP